MPSKKTDTLYRYSFRIYRYDKDGVLIPNPRTLEVEDFSEHEARRTALDLYLARGLFVHRIELVRCKALF